MPTQIDISFLPGATCVSIKSDVSWFMTPVSVRTRAVAGAFFAVVVLLLPCATHAALPNYKLGDVAEDDVITPVPLQVVNPEATDALKQKVAQQVLFIVRYIPQSASEAEAELRASIAATRAKFMAALQQNLSAGASADANVDPATLEKTIGDIAHESPKNLTLAKFAPLWARGQKPGFYSMADVLGLSDF